VAAGLAFSNKMSNNNKISIAFLGDGTLGEGVVYETLNLTSLWDIPIVYILEKNNISQSTSFKQNFSGNIEDRIKGFGIKYFFTSIYNLEELNNTFQNAFSYSRNNSKPVFLEVELARLNSHSKGDDNRDEEFIKKITKIDPLNCFVENNKSLTSEWEVEINEFIKKSLSSLTSEINPHFNSHNLNFESENFQKIHFTKKNDKRYNELIYDALEKILSAESQSIIIGEDIENNNSYNPKEYGGAFKVTRDLSNKYPDQVKNTPISEHAIAGFSIGYALSGKISILEIMFGDFTTLVFDQLLQHVSKFTLMYGEIIKIPFILRTPMGGFRGYGPTHSQSLEKHFLGVPGLRVVVLNQLIEPSEIFNQILNIKEPTLLIENKVLYTKTIYENVVAGYAMFKSNTVDSFPVIRFLPENEKATLTLICYGGILDEVLKAIQLLFVEDEILVELFVVSEISQSNIPGILDSINKTNKLCFIEEGNSFASFSSEVVSMLVEMKCKNFSLLRISNNSIIPSSREFELKVLPTAIKIKSQISIFVNE
jgi:2-oxoisovalerate dehydrogenase E1 component